MKHPVRKTIIAIVIMLVLFWGMMVYRTRKSEQRVQTFVRKVIDSVGNGKDFHKKYLNNDAVSVMKQHMSKDFEIVLLDVDFGLWQYRVIFDKKIQLYISFMKENGDYSVIQLGSVEYIDDEKK